jgi:lipoprotein-releasing system permease protein
MPLLASVAVMLCTAMVLVVWSVMGGFLKNLQTQGKRFSPDVRVIWPAGLAYYEDFVSLLAADPMVKAAAPVIETFGLVSLPDDRVQSVQVLGVDERYTRVVDWAGGLWWKPLEPGERLRRDREGRDPRLEPANAAILAEVFLAGMKLRAKDPATGRQLPAAVVGTDIYGLRDRRNPAGWYEANVRFVKPLGDGSYREQTVFPPQSSIILRVLPLDRKGRSVDLAWRPFPIANEFHTGQLPVDERTVYVDLSELQRMMKMDGAAGVAATFDPLDVGPGGEPLPAVPVSGRVPARATHVAVKAAEGVSPSELRDRVEALYARFFEDPARRGELPHPEVLRNSNLILTWEQANAGILGAVQKEVGLVLFLLWFISLVASFCVLAIFWAMISEKTKDIGILRAIGASRGGVGLVWIGYGLAIGVVGSVLGLTLAHLIVWNINPIHEWMGAALGLQIWDPKVYVFTTIPDKVNPAHALVVLASGLVMSLIGSVIPAARAALMDPVRSLRFE